ncbi:MAG: GNAT family N-acetyltransferase [Cellvibrionaceae bacterium]
MSLSDNPPHHTISSVNQADVNDLQTLASMAIIESVTASKTEKIEIINNTFSHIEKAINQDNVIFLQYKINEPLGFIIIQEYWNLSDLFVCPSFHGNKIGKHLWLAAKKLCFDNGESGFIRVNSSLNAEGFYRKLGFVEYKTENDFPKIIIPLIYKRGPISQTP